MLYLHNSVYIETAISLSSVPMHLLDPLFLVDLYKKHRSRLINSIARLIGCRETAAELAQEAYVRLLVQRNESTLIHPEAYLFRVGRNLAIDHQRKPFSCADFIPLDDELPCTLLQPDELASVRQQCKNLLDAILAMPACCREVFLLRKIDGLGYSEIASRLAISEKTVQRRLVQAMLHCNRRMSGML
jgi:RNA polymerase sigma-70 factor (ECF subfamily)